jgi:nucleoid DNA-binding protein
MNKKDLVEQISLKTGLDISKSKLVIDILKDSVKVELSSGGNISIRKFGRFFLKTKRERKYFNISQQKVCMAPEKRLISFIPSIYLIEEELNGVVISAPSFSSDVRIGGINMSSIISKNETKRNDNAKRIMFSSFAGNILLPNSLNLGQRKRQLSPKEPHTIRFVGKVTNEILVPYLIEHIQYPHILSPKKGIPIIGYNSFGGITGGVTEPVLYYSLLSLREIEPQIEILQNISIPIHNRNYGYKPDIAIIWKERNIYIDIEIDEPYDIVSRKPIHYLNCSDRLRNAYLINNGWFVFRFAEEQIAKNLDNVCHIISKYISFISREKRFMVSSDDSVVDRWTYEKAMTMAAENYREKYLCISPQKNEFNPSFSNYVDDYLAPDHFAFVKPNNDIIDNQYKELEDNLKAELGKQKYFILKRSSDCYEFVTKEKQVQFVYDDESCSYGIKVLDFVEQKFYFVPYFDIESYRTSDSIIKEIKNKDWPSAIYDCIVNCHPIHIEYTNSEGQTAERDVFFLTPWYNVAYKDPENREKYTDLELLSLYSNCIYLDSTAKNQFTYFSGYCSYRQELRTFNVSRINSGIVYNCYKPKCRYENGHMWMQLDEKGDGVLAEKIFHNLSAACKNRLVEKGNLVNALIMQGKMKDAMKICMSIKNDTYIPETRNTWAEMIEEDIDYFISKDNHKEEFEKMKQLLIEKGFCIFHPDYD